jgi:hypothetical protein
MDFYVRYRTSVDVDSAVKSAKTDPFAGIYMNLGLTDLKTI